MSDDLQQGEYTLGRSLMVSAYGGDMPGLEMAALDEARKFFGPDLRLEVVPGYRAFADALAKEASKRYHASVTVREVAR